VKVLQLIRLWLGCVAACLAFPASSHGGEVTPGDSRELWAFQPAHKPAIPAISADNQVLTPVDAFVLARLEQRGWKPAQPASRPQWIRRVYFDLIGLPPAPEEIAAFEADRKPGAHERVVERLLNSRHYGERWAQHWLDVVRYAESEGYEYDRHVPDAWRFRDYVIDSLNRDKPFGRFIREQLAGDELVGSDAAAKNAGGLPDPRSTELLSASIFHRLGPVRRNAGNPDIALSRNEVLTERTDIIGVAFLGLTVGCARCHDHKLDPITQKDYYRLQAYLAATEENNIALVPKADQDAWKAESKRVKEAVAKIKKRLGKATGAQKTKLQTELKAIEAQRPAPLPTIPATADDFEKRTAIHVLKRGIWEKKGEPVGPRPLGALVEEELAELPADASHPRLRLADWIASPANPLTARVIVNRLWQHHFGAGLVATVNDFGSRGGVPSHPELLDWLASTLVENGWRLKPLHRLMVLSGTYRQASRTINADKMETVDPENRLLWRFNRRRLSAEEARDAMLAVSGRLNLRHGGPSVMVPVDEGLIKLLYKPEQWRVTEDASEHNRRSVYLIAKRNLRLPFMETFDAPALQSSCARRETSTHAPQSLEMLNGALSNDLAAAFAERLARETGGDAPHLIERACRLAFGRPPSKEEFQIASAYLRDGSPKEFALAMFNLNAFLYVE